VEHAVDIGGDEPIVPILNAPVDFIACNHVPVRHAGSAEESLEDGYSGRGETTRRDIGAGIYE
jgi:hypothetical protein